MQLTLLLQAVYESLPPWSTSTTVWGNNRYLWGSAYFYLVQPITIVFALLPKYLFEFYKFGYAPNDIDIMRYGKSDVSPLNTYANVTLLAHKIDPKRDFANEAKPLAVYKSAQAVRGSTSRHASRVDVDMSTGLASTHRGFDFSTEEGGVAMRRIQTNLSERRESSRDLRLDSGKKKHFFSLRKRPGSALRT